MSIAFFSCPSARSYCLRSSANPRQRPVVFGRIVALDDLRQPRRPGRAAPEESRCRSDSTRTDRSLPPCCRERARTAFSKFCRALAAFSPATKKTLVSARRPQARSQPQVVIGIRGFRVGRFFEGFNGRLEITHHVAAAPFEFQLRRGPVGSLSQRIRASRYAVELYSRCASAMSAWAQVAGANTAANPRSATTVSSLMERGTSPIVANRR